MLISRPNNLLKSHPHPNLPPSKGEGASLLSLDGRGLSDFFRWNIFGLRLCGEVRVSFAGRIHVEVINSVSWSLASEGGNTIRPHQRNSITRLRPRISVQSPAVNLTNYEGTTIDSELAEKAAILTGIGIGTAFGLLVLLIITIYLIGLFFRFFPEATDTAEDALAAEDDQFRDKALAAAIAVTALLGKPERTSDPGGGG